MTLLSQLFSKFDEISEAMGVYKVRTSDPAHPLPPPARAHWRLTDVACLPGKVLTIGDAYIAVSGIFSRTGGDDDEELLATSEGRTRRRKQNARAIVDFAMAMIDTIKTVRVPPGAPGPLNMRIGIHVGHLTGGVIGMKRLRYDIWGSAFLAATALESNGIPGEVCVSEEVLRQLEGAYTGERHQAVKLKAALKDGSVEVTSYKLLRNRGGPTADTTAAAAAAAASAAAASAAAASAASLAPLPRAYSDGLAAPGRLAAPGLAAPEPPVPPPDSLVVAERLRRAEATIHNADPRASLPNAP